MVGSAIIGTHLLFVSATPSSETMSENSGLFATIAIPFDVSIAEPPPIAIIKSAPDTLNAATPSFTFLTVGFALKSEKIS